MSDKQDNSLQTLYRDALSRLRRVEQALKEKGKLRAGQALASQILRLEVLSEMHLKDLAGITLGSSTYNHPLIYSFWQLWREQYPDYGEPSIEDKAAINRLFRTVVSVSWPQANEVWLRNVFQNFADSTANRIVMFRNPRTFARDFNLFVKGPIRVDNGRAALSGPVRSDGFSR